jgi:hypothetical protein
MSSSSIKKRIKLILIGVAVAVLILLLLGSLPQKLRSTIPNGGGQIYVTAPGRGLFFFALITGRLGDISGHIQYKIIKNKKSYLVYEEDAGRFWEGDLILQNIIWHPDGKTFDVKYFVDGGPSTYIRIGENTMTFRLKDTPPFAQLEREKRD